jgi:uncharacterized protein (DUF983 family)
MTKPKIHIGSILRARCPRCRTGRIMKNPLVIRPRCPECDYNFNPENGFYLGAMVVSYLLTAMLTVPPMIALKLMKVDATILIAFPFVEFAFVGTFLMFYSRILWLHLEHFMSGRLDGKR